MITKEKGLSGSTLKIIAIIIMLIDHIGVAIWYRLPGLGYLVPDVMDQETWWQIYMIIRRVGRTAFPIFCFLLVEGFYHTKRRPKYAIRLFAFSLISQLPFHYAFLNISTRLNVFFTLFIGFMVMWGMSELKKKCSNQYIYFAGWVIIVTVGGLLALGLNTDYDYKGILLIAIFYIFREVRLFSLISGYMTFALLMKEAFYLPGFVLSWFYNGNRGLNTKFLFYLVYPVHLLLFYVVWRYLL
jgi:hypothetical protein